MDDQVFILDKDARLKKEAKYKIEKVGKNPVDFITKKLTVLTRNDYNEPDEVHPSKETMTLADVYVWVNAIHNHPYSYLPSKADIKAAENINTNQ